MSDQPSTRRVSFESGRRASIQQSVMSYLGIPGRPQEGKSPATPVDPLPRSDDPLPQTRPGRKPSLGHAASLPLPQRSLSGEEPPKQKLSRCPTIKPRTRDPSPILDPGTPAVGGPRDSIRRKESITWSPFAALGKAVGSGVSAVGTATKAVGTGVVQGTKAVGTGVVDCTKAVGDGVVNTAHTVSSGVCSAAETVGDGIAQGTKVVGSGVAAVGDGVVSGVTAVSEATHAVGSAVGEAVDDSTSWVKEKRQSVILHTKRTVVHTVEQDETIGIIAAKYKTTIEQIIKLNKDLLTEEGDVEVGTEIRVPVTDRRKSSNRNRSSENFLSSLSTQLGLEDEGESGNADSAETSCLILSSGGIGPRSVSRGFLILETESLIISWGREDPLTFSKEDIINISLIYGSQEQPDYHATLIEKFEHTSGHRCSPAAAHSFSETEVFPVCDEEPELEREDSSQGTDDHSPRQLRTQDSDDLSLSGSFKNSSFDDRMEGGGEGTETTSERDRSQESQDRVENRKIPSGPSLGRRRSRKRSSQSRERRTSLLFEDTMATYLYVELESASVTSKITSSVSPSTTDMFSTTQSSTGSAGEEVMRKSGSFCLQNQPAFLARIPNEFVIRLFSLLMRHYCSQYGMGGWPGENNGFSKLTMDTMQDTSGTDIKVGNVLASKNSFCEPENGVLPTMDLASAILEDDDILALRDRLPTRLENHPWNLAFSTTRDGFSLATLYRKMQNIDSVVLLVIEDVDQIIFGGLLSEPPQVTDSFCGTGECWLFSWQSGELEVYTWTTANQLFIKGCTSSLVVGASKGKFGLWFDEDLNKGRSEECATFGNPPLTPSQDFEVKCIEIWAFGSSI